MSDSDVQGRQSRTFATFDATPKFPATRQQPEQSRFIGIFESYDIPSHLLLLLFWSVNIEVQPIPINEQHLALLHACILT
jgi:hypothetical protein